ncbi:MAG: hypothetical protein NVSMB2_27730 [Chloroflexota bacterium]
MSFFGMGPLELLLIIVLALIVFGPARLPEIMGQVGKAINDFRRATSELSDEFNRTIQAELQETKAVVNETRTVVSDVHTTVNSAMTGTPPAPSLTASPGEIRPDSTAPAANGLAASEAYSSPRLETNGATNGTHAEPGSPPLADTSQWSWETAAPPPPPSQPKSPPEHRPSDVEPPY